MPVIKDKLPGLILSVLMSKGGLYSCFASSFFFFMFLQYQMEDETHEENEKEVERSLWDTQFSSVIVCLFRGFFFFYNLILFF